MTNTGKKCRKSLEMALVSTENNQYSVKYRQSIFSGVTGGA
jgi:hypothetical protein